MDAKYKKSIDELMIFRRLRDSLQAVTQVATPGTAVAIFQVRLAYNGYRYWAIAAPFFFVTAIKNCLTWGSVADTAALSDFMEQKSWFPAAEGHTPIDALKNLDAKLTAQDAGAFTNLLHGLFVLRDAGDPSNFRVPHDRLDRIGTLEEFLSNAFY